MSSRTSKIAALGLSLIFALLLIAGVLVYLPWTTGIFRWPRNIELHWKLWGIVPLFVGVYLVLYCIIAFVTSGHGTPAPFDPPRTLVIQGAYRYVRNPMYWGAFLTLLGEWALFGAGWGTSIYVACFVVLTLLFVRLYEEPRLRGKFGDRYDEYCHNVQRWLPRVKPWMQSSGKCL